MVVPTLGVTRFAQLAPGDLFLALFGSNDSCVAMVAEDPSANGEKLLVPLGPRFPGGIAGPTLISPPGVTVVSFGKNYTLRLPVRAEAWAGAAPPPETVCILVTSSGSYFRVDAGPAPGRHYCYVDIATGRINLTGQGLSQQYAPPAGISAFAVEWEIVTDEPEPRRILAYPYR